MRQKDEMERTENARARSNRHILWLTYGIAALFIAMAVYFGWFIQFKSENVIGSSYNARLDLLSDRVTRGSIMSNDKTVLAQTNIASDGSEKRYYPYDYLFVHSVGYSGKNGKTALIRVVAIENIESRSLHVFQAVRKIAVGHGHFIKIHHHGKIAFTALHRIDPPQGYCPGKAGTAALTAPGRLPL